MASFNGFGWCYRAATGGKAMACGLVEAGADIVIASRHEAELKTALAEILDGTNRRGTYFVADMAQRAEVRIVSLRPTRSR